MPVTNPENPIPNKMEKVMYCERVIQPLGWLEVTHIFCSEDIPNLDVHQAGESSPHDFDSGWWVIGTGQITTEHRDLEEVI